MKRIKLTNEQMDRALRIALVGSPTVRHPDTIPGLAPDCLRVLRAEYEAIQAREQATVPPEPKRTYSSEDLEPARERRRAAIEARSEGIRAAIAEYRRVAKLWGVDVG